MAQPNKPALIRVEYPVDTFKRDELTAGGNGAVVLNAAPQSTFTTAVTGPLPQDSEIELPVLEYGEDGTENECFRNVTLAILMNLRPFVNFLDDVARRYPALTSITLLNKIAQAYWNPNRTVTEREQDLIKPVRDWFAYIQDEQSGIKAFELEEGEHHDASELIHYILDRANDSELSQDDSEVLFRLFQIQTIGRAAYGCDCHEKRRMPKSGSEYSGWSFHVGATSQRRPLEQLIADRLYDDSKKLKKDCPTCGAKQVETHEYFKFQFLPEIFLITVDPAYTKRGTLDRAAKTTMPPELDFSAVQDYPASGASSTADTAKMDTQILYRLQSVGAYSGVGTGGHYTCFQRRSDGSWQYYNDIPVPQWHKHKAAGDAPRLAQLQQRLLVYVRVREGKDGDSAVDETVKPKTKKTQGEPQEKPTKKPKSVSFKVSDKAASPEKQIKPVEPPNTSEWDANKFISEFKSLGVSTGGFRNVVKLRDRYNQYCAADEVQKLSFLIKSKLLELVSTADPTSGLKLASSATNEAIIKALKSHRAAQPQQEAAAVTTKGRTPQKATREPSKQVAAVELSSGVEVDRSASTNQQLEQENKNLRKEVERLLKENQEIKAAKAKLMASLSQANELVFTLQNERARRTPSAPPQPPADDLTTESLEVTQAADPSSTATASGLGESTVIGRPLQSSENSRILKVTAHRVIIGTDAIKIDHHKYFFVPNYDAAQHLVTSQWCHVFQTNPNADKGRGFQHHTMTIYVAIHQREGSKLVYSYDLNAGYLVDPRYRISAELLSIEAAREVLDEVNDAVKWICGPHTLQTMQDKLKKATSAADASTNTLSQQEEQHQTEAEVMEMQHTGTAQPPSPAPLSATSHGPTGPHLRMEVQMLAQQNGHGSIRQVYEVPMENYNPGETTAVTISAQVSATNGRHPSVRQIETQIVSSNIASSNSSFEPVTWRTPSPTELASSGTKRSSPGSNNEGGEEENQENLEEPPCKKKKTETCSRSQKEQEQDMDAIEDESTWLPDDISTSPGFKAIQQQEQQQQPQPALQGQPEQQQSESTPPSSPPTRSSPPSPLNPFRVPALPNYINTQASTPANDRTSRGELLRGLPGNLPDDSNLYSPSVDSSAIGDVTESIIPVQTPLNHPQTSVADHPVNLVADVDVSLHDDGLSSLFNATEIGNTTFFRNQANLTNGTHVLTNGTGDHEQPYMNGTAINGVTTSSESSGLGEPIPNTQHEEEEEEALREDEAVAEEFQPNGESRGDGWTGIEDEDIFGYE